MNRPSDEQGPPGSIGLTDIQRIQRKWQMASVIHFLETFKHILPLKEISPDTFQYICPTLLEQAVADPDIYLAARLAYRDILMAFLLTLKQSSRKNIRESWFLSLRVYVESHRDAFPDCFVNEKNVLAAFGTGVQFIVSVSCSVRLGLLLGLCDVAAEKSSEIRSYIRDIVKDAETVKSGQRNPIETHGLRLSPVGRCSRQRSFYKVGITRIYSGHRRKGTGILLVECSDSKTMIQLADALERSEHDRDNRLARKIRRKFLAPVIEVEERWRQSMERLRQEEFQVEEAQRQTAFKSRQNPTTLTKE